MKLLTSLSLLGTLAVAGVLVAQDATPAPAQPQPPAPGAAPGGPPGQPGQPGGRPGQPGGQPGGGRPMGPPPIIAALDANKDGKLSAEEIANASKALLTLDKNNDGELTVEEFRPAPPPGGPGGPQRPGGPGGPGGPNRPQPGGGGAGNPGPQGPAQAGGFQARTWKPGRVTGYAQLERAVERFGMPKP